jgi:predicted nucleic acid-binding protein
VIVADTSVVVAAFASWHEFHEAARRVLDRGARLPAQAALESYSVLTRLPAPHRAAAALVQEFLADRFRKPYLMLGPAEFRSLLEDLPPLGISGGAAYDALIAAVAREASATLATCDRRAADVYERLGSQVEYIM